MFVEEWFYVMLCYFYVEISNKQNFVIVSVSVKCFMIQLINIFWDGGWCLKLNRNSSSMFIPMKFVWFRKAIHQKLRS